MPLAIYADLEGLLLHFCIVLLIFFFLFIQIYFRLLVLLFTAPFLLPTPEPLLPCRPGILQGRTLYEICLYVFLIGHVFNQLGLSVENTNCI